MYEGFRVIDADAHFYEPWDIWDRYTESEFHSRRPRVEAYPGRARMEFAVDGVFFTGSQKKPGTDQRYRRPCSKGQGEVGFGQGQASPKLNDPKETLCPFRLVYL